MAKQQVDYTGKAVATFSFVLGPFFLKQVEEVQVNFIFI